VSVHVTLRVGAESYALPVEHVLEISEFGEVTPVPGAPRFVLGVRNLRGQILPVVDFGEVLGLTRTPDPQRVLVAEVRGRSAGLAIDEVTDVRVIPEVTEEADSDVLIGATLADGELVGVVDVARVFEKLEQGKEP
jgi:purine-binding chemotaxis protein CheW